MNTLGGAHWRKRRTLQMTAGVFRGRAEKWVNPIERHKIGRKGE